MRRAYLKFCLYFGCTPVPTTAKTVVLYAAFLARSLSSNSIPGYLNIVKLMHLEQGLDNPLDNWQLRAITKGIKRTIGRPPKQKLPITVDLLHCIYRHLNPEDSLHIAFWASCLVAFFAFLRKSTLLPKSQAVKDIVKSLCIKDISIKEKSMFSLHIRHTKTIQFGQRELDIPIAAVAGSVLCPVTAVVGMLAQFPRGSLHGDLPLFCYLGEGGDVNFITHSLFTTLLRSSLKLVGVDISKYSGHSFRRGGCSYAFALGISPQLIKMRGDWRSNVYERYVSILPAQHVTFAKSLALAAK